jgi:hypothetical protein
MAAQKTRPWLQFSLRTMLWVFLSIALGLAAYRRGMTVGEQVGFQKGEEAWLLKEPNLNWVQRVYRVTDLLEPEKRPGDSQQSADILVSNIQADVLSSSWDKNGGGGTITYFRTSGDLVINQHPIAHTRIENYLNQRRMQSKKSLAKE